MESGLAGFVGLNQVNHVNHCLALRIICWRVNNPAVSAFIPITFGDLVVWSDTSA